MYILTTARLATPPLSALRGVRCVRPLTIKEAHALLGELQRGEVATDELGVGGGFRSAATKGFTARVVRGGLLLASTLKHLRRCGGGAPVPAPIPGGDQALYNDIMMTCLQDGIAFAVVW
eukprot:gene7454-17958_t